MRKLHDRFTTQLMSMMPASVVMHKPCTGLKVRKSMVSRDSEPTEVEPLGGKVLGLSYSLADDIVIFDMTPQFAVHLGQCHKDMVMVTNTRLELWCSGHKVLLTRTLLLCLMGVYDPLGLIYPVILKGKLMMQHLYSEHYDGGWDDWTPSVEQERWITWLQ